MKWHLIVNIGPSDVFTPALGATDPRLLIPIAHPTSPWSVSNDVERQIQSALGATIEPIVRDLLHLGLGVYSADLRVPRSRTPDRWTRDLVLYLPVSDVKRWSKARGTLVQLLDFLTGDHWSVEFRQHDASDTQAAKSALQIDAVCLFSGGLDSLVGGIDLLASGKRVALVSHHGVGDATKTIQESVVAELGKQFGGRLVHVPCYVHPQRGNTDEGENTMRARSLLFMSLGVATASVIDPTSTLTVAENGLISLNVPLTGARSGSLSTRTTHPHYMAMLRELLLTLEIAVPLELPYRHMTKGEMLLQAKDKELLKRTLPLTMSCSHPTVGRYAKLKPGNHCGYCIPCMIRLAALKAAGIPDKKPDWDIVKEPPPKTSGRADDAWAFRIGIERLQESDPKTDVFRVLRSGPIPANEAHAFAGVYRRGMKEVADFLKVTLK